MKLTEKEKWIEKQWSETNSRQSTKMNWKNEWRNADAIPQWITFNHLRQAAAERRNEMKLSVEWSEQLNEWNELLRWPASSVSFISVLFNHSNKFTCCRSVFTSSNFNLMPLPFPAAIKWIWLSEVVCGINFIPFIKLRSERSLHLISLQSLMEWLENLNFAFFGIMIVECIKKIRYR